MTTELQVEGEAAPFDYDSLDPADAQVAQEAATHIKRYGQQMIADIVEIGSALIRAKDALRHGNFEAWLKISFGWKVRTAQNYMSVAQRLAEKAHWVAGLPLATTYRLAAKGTPDDLRTSVITRLEQGEKVSADDINAAISDRLQANRQAEENAAKSPTQLKTEERKASRAQAKIDRELAEAAAAEARRKEARERGMAIIVGSLDADDRAQLMPLLDIAGSICINHSALLATTA